jgi:hypothetical protein
MLDWQKSQNTMIVQLIMMHIPLLCVQLLPCPLINSETCLVLDPSQKTEHICKYWGQEKLESILKEAEETFSVLSFGVSVCAHNNIIVQAMLP